MCCARYALRRLPGWGRFSCASAARSSPGDGLGTGGKDATGAAPCVRRGRANLPARSAATRRSSCGRTSGRACLSRPIFCAFAPFPVRTDEDLRDLVRGKAWREPPVRGLLPRPAHPRLAIHRRPASVANVGLQAECRSASKRTFSPCPPRQRPADALVSRTNGGVGGARQALAAAARELAASHGARSSERKSPPWRAPRRTR